MQILKINSNRGQRMAYWRRPSIKPPKILHHHNRSLRKRRINRKSPSPRCPNLTPSHIFNACLLTPIVPLQFHHLPIPASNLLRQRPRPTHTHYFPSEDYPCPRRSRLVHGRRSNLSMGHYVPDLHGYMCTLLRIRKNRFA